MRSGDALVLGVRLAPDTFAQLDSVRNGVTYYRRLGVTAELQRRVVLLLVAGMTVLLVIASVLLSARLARQTAQPLQALSNALGRVAGGELSARVEPGGAAELRSLGESFNTMTRRLDEARQAVQQAEREAAWRDVARKLAHEFKNTLTPMRLSLQLLEAHLDEAPAEQRGPMERSLKAALREVESLTRLAGQFSQYARLPEPSFESVDLTELARNAGALLEDGVVSVRAAGSGSTTVRADPLLVSRALGNLLLNAREAAPGPSPVEIVVVPRRDVVEIQVLDRGSGLPEDLRDRLFEPYVSTKKRGSGLGLSLIRDIARQHHGSVTLENRADGGARACLTLPRDPARAAATDEPPAHPEDPA
jgi:nitrogen fixation/metabolism regulation signal transduction histidine kinase